MVVRFLEGEPTAECSLCLGLVRGFAAPKVDVEVVEGWVAAEEPLALDDGHHQSRVAELTPNVGKHVCSGHRPRK